MSAADQTAALVLLWNTAQGSHGGASVCARLLLGLYNDTRFPFPLTNLRRLDEEHLDAALTVLRMDANPAMEVHEMLNVLFNTRTMGPRFELLAHNWRLRHACTAAEAKELRERISTLAQAEAARRAAATAGAATTAAPAPASTCTSSVPTAKGATA